MLQMQLPPNSAGRERPASNQVWPASWVTYKNGPPPALHAPGIHPVVLFRKSGEPDPGWSDEASQALFASRKKVIQVPAFAAFGVTSFQCDPPSVVRRIRSVVDPAAHPVLRSIMCIDAGASSG